MEAVPDGQMGDAGGGKNLKDFSHGLTRTKDTDRTQLLFLFFENLFH